MNFEKPQESVSNLIFHSRDEFKRSVNEAVEAEKKGYGPTSNSPAFVRSIIGNTELTSEQFNNLRQEIMLMVNEINPKDEVGSVFSDEEIARIRKSTGTGSDVDDSDPIFSDEERKKMIKDSESHSLKYGPGSNND